jgi:hypothetical protein
MPSKIYIARPRLDCSFKKGPVPPVEGPPKNRVLTLFGQFMDNLGHYHSEQGDHVVVDQRPLWQFELDELRQTATRFDLVYFPHRLRSQWPAGDNVLFYKTTPFPEYISVDPQGWGASLSWLPVHPIVSEEAWAFFQTLQQRAALNVSVFDQPALDLPVGLHDYFLFVCQLPHDETIQFHSTVSVENALHTVIQYAEQARVPLVVKGHPANRPSMLPLKALTDASPNALWVDEVSIHTCLAGARRVFTVNSGVGFEAMLHDKTVVHFGNAEYSSVTLHAACSVDALRELAPQSHSTELYAAFLHCFFQKTIRYDRLDSFAPILQPFRERPPQSTSAPHSTLTLPAMPSAENPPAPQFKTLPPAVRSLQTLRLITQRASDRPRWANPANFPPNWSSRARVAARLLPPPWRVLDMGCGTMSLERELAEGNVYLPADLVPRDPRTLPCDLNAGQYPDVDADCAVLLGVLEYVHTPQEVLSQIASRWPRLLLSYNCVDRDGARNRYEQGWFSQLTQADLVQAAQRARLALQGIVPLGEKESLFLFHSEAR